MTTEIEKTFFDTFGIKPKRGCTAYDKFTEEEADILCDDRCRACLYFDDIYQRITPEILLELIKLLIIDEGVNISGFNIVDLDGRQYKKFGITCLDYFYDEPECDEEDYEPIQSTGTLKECVLKALILINEKYNDFLKHQVRTLFEEG